MISIFTGFLLAHPSHQTEGCNIALIFLLDNDKFSDDDDTDDVELAIALLAGDVGTSYCQELLPVLMMTKINDEDEVSNVSDDDSDDDDG